MNFPISSVNRPGHPTGATLKICAVQVFNVADAVSCMWKVPESGRAARCPVTRTGGELAFVSRFRCAALARVVPAPAYDPKRRRVGASRRGVAPSRGRRRACWCSGRVR
jgi:hypothetical protein